MQNKKLKTSKFLAVQYPAAYFENSAFYSIYIIVLGEKKRKKKATSTMSSNKSNFIVYFEHTRPTLQLP